MTLRHTLSRGIGYGLGVSPRAGVAPSWPLDWTATGAPLPTILYQCRWSPDQASMVQNIGSGAPAYNGTGSGMAVLPAHDVDRGAVFRGADPGYTVADGWATGYPATNTGTLYYYVRNQRLTADRGSGATFQRTGYDASPRSYLSHYFVIARFLWGSGSTTHVDNGWSDAAGLALSPGKAYRDGVLVNGALSTSWLTQPVMFGGLNGGGVWRNPAGENNWFCCDVPIFAFWASPISDGQMAAWHAAVVSMLEL